MLLVLTINVAKNHGSKRGRKAYSRGANGKIFRPTQTNNKKSKKIKDKESVKSAV